MNVATIPSASSASSSTPHFAEVATRLTRRFQTMQERTGARPSPRVQGADVVPETLNLLDAGEWLVARKRVAGVGNRPQPLAAYAEAPQGGGSLRIESADFFGFPSAPGRLAQRIKSAWPNAKRVVICGARTDLIHQVHAEMTGAKLSTSIAFKSEHLKDLLPIAPPHVCLLHLSAGNDDAFPALARLIESPKPPAIMFLLDDPVLPSDDEFFRRGFEDLARRYRISSRESAA